MSRTWELNLYGEAIKVSESKDYYEVRFSDGRTEKLYHHVNAQKDAVWMWESGKIDRTSLSIGAMIDESISQTSH